MCICVYSSFDSFENFVISLCFDHYAGENLLTAKKKNKQKKNNTQFERLEMYGLKVIANAYGRRYQKTVFSHLKCVFAN